MADIVMLPAKPISEITADMTAAIHQSTPWKGVAHQSKAPMSVTLAVPPNSPSHVRVVLIVGAIRTSPRNLFAQFLRQLGSLPIIVDSETAKRAFSEVLAIAHTERLSAYDAAYLELALREGCPLATLDAALAACAKKPGVGKPTAG
jgi:predicted nucleic acid-binding protein